MHDALTPLWVCVAQPLKTAKKNSRMWQLFESVREDKMKIIEREQAIRKHFSRNMFSEFFGDLWYNTFALLASFLPFFSYTSRGRGAPASSNDDQGLEDGEERYFEELYFRLLREELDDGVIERGDHLNVRFTLLRAPQSLTVFGVKSLLFQKYGLTPEKVRLCAMTDIPPAAGSGGGDASEEHFDAEVRELPDTTTLRECHGLTSTSTLYLDYIFM